MKLVWFKPSFMTAMFMVMFGSASLFAMDGQSKAWSFFDGSGIKATNDAAFTSQASIMSDSTTVGAYSASPFVKATSLFTSATVLRAVPVSDVIYSKAGTIISTPPILGIMSDSTTAKMFGSGSGLTASSEFGSGASRTSTTAQDGLFFKTDASSSAATSHETMINTGHTSYSSYILKAVTFILMGTIIALIVTNIGTRKEETADIIVEKEGRDHTHDSHIFSARSVFKSFIVKFPDKEHGAKAYSKHYFGKLMSSIISLFQLVPTKMTDYGGSPALSSSKA